jgi:S-adenosylmethionine synthetase
MSDFLFTSESVTEGHPDKVCDRIADAVLDDLLRHDKRSRVACEVMANTGLIVVFGEITTQHYCSVPQIVRRTLDQIGYHHTSGFNGESCAVMVSIDEQSPDIAAGVANSLEARRGSTDPLDAQGAGDQGLMFGYASLESEAIEPGSYMPLPVFLAHRLSQRLAEVRREGLVPGLMPDGKTQVTLEYRGFRPHRVRAVLISTQHLADTDGGKLRAALIEHVLQPTIPAELFEENDDDFLINPSGLFIKGGPEADSGLTGRKLIVDTYGGMARHGGGALSGKDPSKVDRCASYYSRYVAKNLVAAGVAERLELQVSYAIGRARPMGLMVECFGTERCDPAKLNALLESGELFDFRPLAIINNLNLLDVAYEPLANYGAFGRSDVEAPWETLDKVDAVRQALGLGLAAGRK